MRNKYAIRDNTAYIYLRHRMAWYKTALDLADLPLARKFRGTWCLLRTSNGLRVRGSIRDARAPAGITTLYLARLLTGADPGTIVRHVDGNGLNHRRANLLVSVKESAACQVDSSGGDLCQTW